MCYNPIFLVGFHLMVCLFSGIFAYTLLLQQYFSWLRGVLFHYQL
jgi:hypothetical protein